MWSDELEALRPEAHAFNQQLLELLKDTVPLESQPIQEARDARMAGEGTFPAPVFLDHAEDRMIGPNGDIPVRVVVPDDIRGVYLHIHGGGWVIGNAISQDPMLDRVATATGAAVVSVEYPLGPEDPYPAGPDVCEAAAMWMLEHMEAEFGTSNLVIGGESAGAHLSVVTLLRMRDQHDAAGAVAAANLVYGCFDLTRTPSCRAWTENLVLSPGNLQFFFESYLGDRDAEACRHPDISPLYADLSGMPPALFSVGTRDPLLDDSLFMHGRWLAAGNSAELEIYPDGIHAFNAFPTALAHACNDRIDSFIAEALT